MAGPPLSMARVAKDLIFTSGQLPRGDDGALVAGGIEAQTEQALANLERALAQEGASLKDVIKVTAWLTDASHAAGYNQVYARAFPTPYPARSTVISGLLMDEALVEIEAIALRP